MEEALKAMVASMDLQDPASCVAVVRALYDEPQTQGSSLEKVQRIASMTGKSASWVRSYYALRNAAPAVLEQYRQHRILAADAQLIARQELPRQEELAAAIAALPDRAAVKLYLRKEFYAVPASLLDAPKKVPAQGKLAKRRTREALQKEEMDEGERATARLDYRGFVESAMHALDPMFNARLAHIVAAFAGSPSVRNKVIEDMREAANLLTSIADRLEATYGKGT